MGSSFLVHGPGGLWAASFPAAPFIVTRPKGVDRCPARKPPSLLDLRPDFPYLFPIPFTEHPVLGLAVLGEQRCIKTVILRSLSITCPGLLAPVL